MAPVTPSYAPAAPPELKQVGNPQLRRMLSGSGSAAALCSTLRGGADGAGGCPRDGFNALHVAVAVGWLEMVERLLLVGAGCW